LSLLGHPGMKMVGDQQELETGLLRHLCVGNQFIRFMFLTG